MIVLKLSVVLVVGLQLTAVPVSGAPSAGTSIYNGIWTKTAIKSELGSLRTDIESRRNAMWNQSAWQPVGVTIRINEFYILLKKFALRFADVSIGYLEALESVVETGNIPEEDVFEQSERASKRFRKFFEHEGKKFAHEVRELIGCPTGQKLDDIFRKMHHQIEYIAQTLHRIEEAVEGKENKLEFVTRLATVVFNRVVKLKAIIEGELYGSFGFTVDSITLGNYVQYIFQYYEIIVNQSVNNSIQSMASYLTFLNTSAQNVYITEQQTIRANLSSAISQLSVFSNNTKLAKLSHEISENYARMYHFLRKQNSSDLENIVQNYNNLYENSVNIIQNMTSIMENAANRTVLLYTYLGMNGYFKSNCNGFGYFGEAYADFTGSVTQCIDREQLVWTSTLQAFNCSTNILQTASNAVASSVALCNNTNFANDPIMFAKSKACLKTNKKDSGHLVKILKPQFEHIDRLLEHDVEASKFRLENCLATATHEITAMLKTTRALFRSCTVLIDGCPLDEDKYEDDEADWYWRYRDEGEDHKKHGHKESLLKTVDGEDLQEEPFENGNSVDSEEVKE